MASTHFSDKELACHHCGCLGALPQIFNALEAFRAIAGRPVFVLSGYRCPIANAITPNAAKNSQHVQGIAADITVEGMTPAEMEAIARKIPGIHGIGRADKQGYIHVDTRAEIAQWCYNADGASIAYFPPDTTPA